MARYVFNVGSSSLYDVTELLLHTRTVPVIEGVEGGSVTLPCTQTGNREMVWYRGAHLLILMKAPDGTVVINDGPYKDVVSLVGGTDLRINSLDRVRDQTDGGIFRCLYTDRPDDVGETHVRVLALITGARIDEASGGTVAVTEGEPKKITCTGTGAPIPEPSFEWRVDGGPVIGQGQTFSLTTNRSTETVTCTATNTYSNGTELSMENVTVSLNVQYLDSPLVATTVTVKEGDGTVLHCSAVGNPRPSFTWTRSGSTHVIGTTANYTTEPLVKSDAGKYTCEAWNLVGRKQGTVTLVVLYKPLITLTYKSHTNTLTCAADGDPDEYSFSQWEHRLGGELLRSLGTVSTESPAILELGVTSTYEDTGYYKCQVSNGIKGAQQGEIYIAPQTPAVSQHRIKKLQLTEGAARTISVPFYTYSVVSNVKVGWQKQGESTALQSHREEPGLVTLVIHGQSVKIQGTVTSLTLEAVTQSDGGNYTVTVTNDIDGVSEARQATVTVTVQSSTSSALIGGIVGGVVGAVVLILVAIIIVFIRRRRRKNSGKSGHKAKENTTGQTDVVMDGKHSESSFSTTPYYEKIGMPP